MSLTDGSLTRRAFTALGIGAAAAIVTGHDAGAQEGATPAADGSGLPPLPAGATVVAEGLWNPINLAFGPDGTLYVTESGVGGGGGPEEGMATPNAEGTPFPAPAALVPGQVSAITPDGTVSVLAGDLGSVVGIAVRDMTLYVSAGGGSIGSGFAPNPEENTVSAIDIPTGAVTVLAELGSYEAANNPDGTDVNPNLYGLAIDAAGLIYVADAGGNTIYTVDPAGGGFALFAVVPNLTELTGATPTAEEQAAQPGPRQPVPTSVVIDNAGNIVVALLSEAWNGPSILSFAPDGSYTVGVSGLSMIVNAALGLDGLLYVSQLTTDFSAEMPAPGNVIRINADGSTENVVEGLFFPHGIAFDTEGNLYVSTNSIISGPDAPLGQVLRIDGIAPPS
jgi:sugar lactone lactonase YvrE